jgi:hypothetical protein
MHFFLDKQSFLPIIGIMKVGNGKIEMVSVAFRIPKVMYEHFLEKSSQERRSISNIMRNALDDYLVRIEKSKSTLRSSPTTN